MEVNNIRDDIRTLKDDFRVFLEMLEKGNDDAINLLRYFERYYVEEQEILDDLKELTSKIMRKLEDEGQIKKE